MGGNAGTPCSLLLFVYSYRGGKKDKVNDLVMEVFVFKIFSVRFVYDYLARVNF